VIKINLKEFGLWFTEQRIQSGYKSQRELAEKSGISHSTINRLESGTHKTSIENLKILSKHLRTVKYEEVITKAGYIESDPAAPYITAKEQSEQKETVEEQSEVYEDPKVSRFFKDFKSAPAEKQEEAMRFWEFIQQQEKGRKPGDKQGE
jgi:transcriptional regulator with XRE-family HTH domain